MLEKSEVLGRKIRRDDTPELGIPTWQLVREAIRVGQSEDALKLLDYGCDEHAITSDSLVSFVDDALTHLAGFGEEEIYKVTRKRYYEAASRRLSETPEEYLQRNIEGQRGHGANITIVEEPDRYVVKLDPCGSGGRLRRNKKSLGTTRQPYPWTWSTSGVPYYCSHCCVLHEILPIELHGYPSRITIVGRQPEDPCIHYYYKRPELIPDEYFSRVGKKRTT